MSEGGRGRLGLRFSHFGSNHGAEVSPREMSENERPVSNALRFSSFRQDIKETPLRFMDMRSR